LWANCRQLKLTELNENNKKGFNQNHYNFWLKPLGLIPFHPLAKAKRQ
jgi:hypothetical protein